ncbi:MAG: alpha/beta hydrolase fold domain-containing protein [Acetobacteraceae bacterium]
MKIHLLPRDGIGLLLGGILLLMSATTARAQQSQGNEDAPRYAPTPPVLYKAGVRSFRDVIYAQLLGFRPLTMDLYLPPASAQKKPVVVFIHGGAWRHLTARDGGAIRDFPAVLASVAAHNYVVASVNYRLSGEARFPTAVQDVALAIRWLRLHSTRYGIDTNRFVVWGSSAGGEIATLLGTACGVQAFQPAVVENSKLRLPSTCVQGVIDWYGLVDLEADGTDLGRPDAPDYVDTYLGCQLSRCPPGWARSATPFPYINAKDPPFLIQHGADDTTVSPSQSKRLYKALRAAGVPAELVIYPGVKHGFAKAVGGGPDDAVDQQAMAKVFEFLGRYFPSRK